MTLDIDYAVTTVGCPTTAQFTQWVDAALNAAKHAPGDIAIRIVDREEIRQLNRDYRQQDKPTNVLSFPFEMPAGVPLDPILGDLAICAAIVEQEAQEQHKTLQSHWAHMTIHGTLHLIGYDHITDDQAAEMEGLEISIMQQLGFINPYC